MYYVPEFFLLMCGKWCSVKEDRDNWNDKDKKLILKRKFKGIKRKRKGKEDEKDICNPKEEK